jgi:hypothetical protein
MLIKTYDQYALLTFELDLVQDAPRLSFVMRGQPRPNSTEIDQRSKAWTVIMAYGFDMTIKWKEKHHVHDVLKFRENKALLSV